MSRIAVIGPSSSGKSSIVHTYTTGKKPERAPAVTIGVDLHVGQCTTGHNIYIWDTAGGPSQNEVLKHYLPGCHGIMVVYDCTKPEEDQLRDIQGTLDLATQLTRSIDRIPKLVVGSKVDLMPLEPKMPPTVQRFVQFRRIKHAFTSCDSVEQVSQLFDMLLDIIDNTIPSPLSASRPPDTVREDRSWCSECRIT
tara:strand:+ start:21201 stop:21785 length:585 start_codon:yes stop_codon:yes gene_type:complete